MSPPLGQLLFAIETGQAQITYISLAREMYNIIIDHLIQNTRDMGSGEELKPRQNKEISSHFTMLCCHLIYYHILLLPSQCLFEAWLFPLHLYQQMAGVH